MSCGAEHSLALTTEGELYSWGLNFKGQLGVGDFENKAEPCLVESLLPIDGPNSQSKKNIIQMIKRSKSKEQVVGQGVEASGARTRDFSATMTF